MEVSDWSRSEAADDVTSLMSRESKVKNHPKKTKQTTTFGPEKLHVSSFLAGRRRAERSP